MAVQATQSNMPVVILKDGASQSKGLEAQKNNISAAKIIAEIVRTSLGPRGMDKMLVDSLGDVTITNDGATILKEIDVQHPAAKMLVEIAKTTDNEVGDGTTSAVVLAGSLLEQAESLLLQEVHPTIIVDGYRKSAVKAKQYLKDIAEQVTANDKSILLKIASTSMQTKLVKRDSSQLSEMVVRAITAVAEKQGEDYTVDIEDIKNLNTNAINKKSEIATLACKIKDKNVLNKSNIVKVITDEKISKENISRANTFSREVLFNYNTNIYHHIGIYIYKVSTLEKFVNLKQTKNEIDQRLEQLRAIDNNIEINVILANSSPIGVDTEEDFLEIKKIMNYKD